MRTGSSNSGYEFGNQIGRGHYSTPFTAASAVNEPRGAHCGAGWAGYTAAAMYEAQVGFGHSMDKRQLHCIGVPMSTADYPEEEEEQREYKVFENLDASSWRVSNSPGYGQVLDYSIRQRGSPGFGEQINRGPPNNVFNGRHGVCGGPTAARERRSPAPQFVGSPRLHFSEQRPGPVGGGESPVLSLKPQWRGKVPTQVVLIIFASYILL